MLSLLHLDGFSNCHSFGYWVIIHWCCIVLAKESCEKGQHIIIIDNTHVKAWETKFYVSLANEFGYVVFMVTPRGQYTTSAHELARRNKHGVSVDVIKEKLEVSLLRSKYQLVTWSYKIQSWRLEPISAPTLKTGVCCSEPVKRFSKSCLFSLNYIDLFTSTWFGHPIHTSRSNIASLSEPSKWNTL